MRARAVETGSCRWVSAPAPGSTGTSAKTRSRYVTPPDAGWLWLTKRGRRLTGKRLGALVSDYVTAADLGKTGSCHLFRHTMATLMLEGGADVRHIQEILGHAELSTTALYTHLSIGQLQQVHRRTHPARMPGVRRVGEASHRPAAKLA